MASSLVDVIAALAALRTRVEKVLDEGGWVMAGSHAETEALAFMQLAIGNVAAIETLARADPRLVIAATAAGRSAYEGIVTLAWMLAPDDLAERDRRWMALFFEERAFWQRVVDEAIKRGDSQTIVINLQAEVQRVGALIDAVQPQLAATGAGAIPRKLPIFEVRLEEVGQGRHFVTYKVACQLVHPTTRALAQVRDLQAHADEIPLATYSYRTKPRDWTVAISLAAESLAFGLETIGRRLPPGRELSPEVADLFNAVADKLRVIG
jgi:hypothetical protein